MSTWKSDRINQTQEAAAALYERIQRFFAMQAPREQSITLELKAGRSEQESEGQEAYRTLHFVLPDDMMLAGFVRVANIGGNMYEVEAGVGDRSATFDLSFPHPSSAGEDQYGRPVCDFLLEEIERAAGELHLRKSSSS